jgi:chaperonin cofactor prefoldin
MEKEREERVEVENSVEALRRQLRKVEEKFDTVDADLAERQARAEDLRNGELLRAP